MTKKHFEWGAAYVRDLRTRGLFATTCRATEDAYADLFRAFGPRFDERRFRDACKVARPDDVRRVG